jgi:hypothetical protein
MAKHKKVLVKTLLKDTYLAIIKNACGSVIWSNYYALVNGKKEDIVHDGATSCAFFVSSILKTFDLIKKLHLTVKGTEKDLKESGWQRIKVSSKMPKGSIIIWERKLSVDKQLKKQERHNHIGFYIGDEKAVSIWTYHNFPVIHHWTYNKSRKIIRVYWNKQIKNQ